MPTTTTNYSWNKPAVGGDEDAWGGYLNGNWDSVDTLLGGVTNTEFEILDGATVTTAELNILDGVTATTAELNILDGVTSTAAELNLLDGVTATTAELNYVDGVTSAIQTQLNAKVGATYTGDVDITGELLVDSYNETYAALSGTSPAVNCETGNSFSLVLSGNSTFTFTNPPASGTAYTFSIEIIQDASASGFTVTWPSSVDWPAATAPTLTATASAKDIFVLTSRDGGTNWYGFTAGQALG
tara:strand:+ start:3613 stop:4341 length:729 start_codon:yes stop_codon:yes gene_type:complete